MKSPIVLLLSLLTGVKRLEPDVKGLDRDIITIEARFKHEGYGFLSIALLTLGDSLDRGLSSGQFTCPSGFSKIRRGVLPRLFSGLLCEVFDSQTGSLKQNPSIGVIKCLREILKLFKKCQLTDECNDELHSKAVDTFWDTDKECKTGFQPSDAQLYLFSRVSRFALQSLKAPQGYSLPAKHGPGAVYESLTPNQKWNGVARALLDSSDRAWVSNYGFDCFLSSSRTEESLLNEVKEKNLKTSYEVQEDNQLPYTESDLRLSSGQSAKLFSVAKNSQQRRTITAEPLLNMFIQQGLNTKLRDFISESSILSSSLALSDQSKNQQLALEGSRTGEWSTIDLSSASDRLSLTLVETTFASAPAFLQAMKDCRSVYVHEVGKPPRELYKFAGMGNALTFPVQSVVFTLVVITSMLSCVGLNPTYGNVKRMARRVRVYGDDIIVPTVCVHQVMDWLESFGLKVNRKKSFTEGNFRESCGLDAFRGYEVTPMYIKNKPDDLQMEPSALAGFVSLSNQAWLKGQYEFANELRQLVEASLRRRLPLVSLTSGALGWHSRQDSCCAQRWDNKLQRLVFKAPVLINHKMKDKLDGEGALLKFFLTPLIARNTDHLKQSIRRFSQKLVWKYHPSVVNSNNL